MGFKNLKFFLIVILVFLAFVLINKFFYFQLRSGVNFVFSPIEKLFWQEGAFFSDVLDSIFNFKKIKIENQELRKENFILWQKNLEQANLKEENEEMKEALGIEAFSESFLIAAYFIGKDPEQELIFLNKGENQGVAQDMPVLTKQGVLVGKIDQVFSNHSRVALITHNLKFSVEILPRDAGDFGEQEILALCRGRNGKLALELAPKESDIKVKDVVSTSVLGGMFPQGLLVGEVEEMERNDAEPFQQGLVHPYFLDSDLKILFLLKPEG